MLDKLPTASEPTPQSLDLVEPMDEAWPVASLGLGWDEERQRIVVVAESRRRGRGRGAGDGTPSRSHARRPGVRRARGVAGGKAGRPLCPMCSQPKDPAGHVCPRSNGHVVTA